MKKDPELKKWLAEQSMFPVRLRLLLLRNNTYQVDLAEAIGLSKQTVSLYTLGKAAPDIFTLQKIADYFNVNAGYLLGENLSSSARGNEMFTDFRFKLADILLDVIAEQKDEILQRLTQEE